jgi:hypothetical protein
VLIDAISIAIWNRNKVVVTLTIIAWGTGIGFHLYSKLLPLVPVEDLESCINVVGDRYRAGKWPINKFGPTRLISSVGSLCMGLYASRL